MNEYEQILGERFFSERENKCTVMYDANGLCYILYTQANTKEEAS